MLTRHRNAPLAFPIAVDWTAHGLLVRLPRFHMQFERFCARLSPRLAS